MFNDQICDSACNNWECGRDGDVCSVAEAEAVCRPQSTNLELLTKPDGGRVYLLGTSHCSQESAEQASGLVRAVVLSAQARGEEEGAFRPRRRSAARTKH